MKNIKAFLNLIRWINVVLVLLAVVLGIKFSGLDSFKIDLIYLFLSPALVLSGANAINNALDSNRDSPLKKNPVASGAFTRSEALSFGLGLTVLGLIFSAMMGALFFLLATATALSLLFYNLYAKDIFLIGNLIVAGVSGFLFVYIGLFFDNYKGFYIAAVFAFISHLIREIIKDIEDRELDKKENSKTMAIILGPVKTVWIIYVFLFLLAISIPLPYLLGLFGIVYIVFALISLLPLIISVMIALSAEKYHLAQKLMKILMLFGLTALFMG